MIKFHNLLKGFRWSTKENFFDNTYTKPHSRHNYHVIFLDNTWAVHGEGLKEVQRFSNKNLAITYAKKQAENEKTEALIHDEKGIIETAWIYAPDAYPQKKLYPADQYPIESHPGKQVI